MPIHFGNHLAQNLHNAGVALLPQELPIGQIIEILHLIWQASTAEEWIDKIEFF